MGPPRNPSNGKGAQKRASRGSSSGAKAEVTHGASATGQDHVQGDAFARPQPVPLEHQQAVLDLFKTSFRQRIASDPSRLLQEIKGHLYNRDFDAAFGRPDYLEAYAIRWSPSRALAYLDIFRALPRDMLKPTSSPREDDGPPTLRVTCFGGGAGAEVVALATCLGVVQPSPRSTPNLSGERWHLVVRVADIANWSTVLEKLGKATLATQPSDPGIENGSDLPRFYEGDENNPAVGFRQCDLLDLSSEELQSLVVDARLITIMFTLNELYAASRVKTTKLLLDIGSVVQIGTFLLVVDSPGSYSSVKLGSGGAASQAEQKTYPMHWLLDHTLLSAGAGAGAGAGDDEPGKEACVSWRWKKITGEESRWFRFPENLRYPVDLENMRYQIHLYELVERP
ncbi:MAG: hypothetical protein M1838_003460 [Thelocarpon superellum]|nr:MAG: hypothetical protein M1838_003460 [Thelocarpon superellum]